jgi:hypothetical protein
LYYCIGPTSKAAAAAGKPLFKLSTFTPVDPKTDYISFVVRKPVTNSQKIFFLFKMFALNSNFKNTIDFSELGNIAISFTIWTIAIAHVLITRGIKFFLKVEKPTEQKIEKTYKLVKKTIVDIVNFIEKEYPLLIEDISNTFDRISDNIFYALIYKDQIRSEY